MYYVAKSATDKRTVIGKGLNLQDAIKMCLAMSEYSVFSDGGSLVFPTYDSIVKVSIENKEEK